MLVLLCCCITFLCFLSLLTQIQRNRNGEEPVCLSSLRQHYAALMSRVLWNTVRDVLVQCIAGELTSIWLIIFFHWLADSPRHFDEVLWLKTKSQHILDLLRFQGFVSLPEMSCNQRYCLSVSYFILSNSYLFLEFCIMLQNKRIGRYVGTFLYSSRE